MRALVVLVVSACVGGCVSGNDQYATAPAVECTDSRLSFPVSPGVRCTEETRACIARCAAESDDPYEAQPCAHACARADTTPALTSGSGRTCASCMTVQTAYCADVMGCHAQVANTLCCLRDRCPDAAADESCLVEMCEGQLRAFIECAPPSCISYTDPVFEVCYGDSVDA